MKVNIIIEEEAKLTAKKNQPISILLQLVVEEESNKLIISEQVEIGQDICDNPPLRGFHLCVQSHLNRYFVYSKVASAF